jgi:hypothetical protein
MNPKDDLFSLLKFRDDKTTFLSTREGSRLEFKETFNLGSLAKYTKTMAGQANNSGGYILFGIKDSPRELIGLRDSRFDDIDPIKITRFLNTNFNPEINWEMDCITIKDKVVGYIYTHESTNKPIICTSNNGNELYEAKIYYRFRGMTSDIKYPELRSIIDRIITNERNSWMQNIERMARVGPSNTAILDLINKELINKGSTYVIDQSLIEKIKFIKSGEFNESEGELTLKLVGEVLPTSSISVNATIPIGIDYDSLFLSFLSQKNMTRDEARAFLKEAFCQNTIYVPMFYYLKLSEIGIDEIEVITDSIHSISKKHIDEVLGRLKEYVPIVLEDEPSIYSNIPLKDDEVIPYINRSHSVKEKKKITIALFQKRNDYIIRNIDSIDENILFQAIVDMPYEIISQNKAFILGILTAYYLDSYRDWTGITKTYFRKAVAHIDQELFSLS